MNATDTTSAPTIHAVVVDDHPLFRRGVVQLLKESPGFRVLADFDSALDYFDHIDELPAELLLLDLQMPDISGLDVLRRIKAINDEMRVVMITASTDSEHLIAAISAGADGYLLKDTAPDDMIQQLKSVMAGQVALNPAGVSILAEGLRNQEPASTPETSTDNADNGSELTLREQQTLKLIAQGMSNKLIARELGISDGTVKVYVKNLLRKLNLHSRLELAAWAHSHSVLTEEH
ncbi:MAG: response regulator [Pseudomonadota bacterium]|nr:response regulator [Pseudomonadota bacterium]